MIRFTALSFMSCYWRIYEGHLLYMEVSLTMWGHIGFSKVQEAYICLCEVIYMSHFA